MKRAIPRLAGLAEVAALLAEQSPRGKVSPSYAWSVAGRPGFPEPVQRLAMGPVWAEADVKEYLATPRRPGRKAKATTTEGASS